MAGELEPTGVELVAEGQDQFEGALEGGADALDAFEGAANTAAEGLDAFGTIVTGALMEVGAMAVDAMASAANAVIGFVQDGFAGAMEAEQTLTRLGTLITSTGEAAGITVEEASALATEFMDLAGGSDDAVLAIEEMALRMGNITEEEMPGFIQTVLDYAAATGTDAVNAARLFSMAQDDASSVLARLKKAGILVNEETEEQIKSMMEAGDEAGAYALLMERVGEATGGAAAAQAGTLAGQIEILKGHFGEAAETVANSFLPIASLLFDEVLAPAIPIIDSVATSVGNMMTLLLTGDFSGGIFGLMEDDPFIGALFSVRDVALGIADAVVNNWPLIQSTAESVFGSFQSIAETVGAFINDTLMPAIERIWTESGAQLPDAQATFEAVMNGISTAMDAVAAFIEDPLIPAFETAVDWVVENWPEIQATIETVINQVQDVVETVISAVVSFWQTNGDSIISNTQTTWDTIVTTVDTVIHTAQTVIETVLNAIDTFWDAHGQSIMTIVSTTFETIQTNVDTGINAVQTVIETVLNAIDAFWDTWGGTIMTIVDNMVANIGLAIDGFAALLEGDFSAVGEAIRGIWDNNWENMISIASTAFDAILSVDWLGLGGDIVQGIADGISNGASAIADAAMAAAQAALDAAMGFLGIESPSKVTYDLIGTPYIEGIEAAMYDGMDALAGAATAVAGAMLPSDVKMPLLTGSAVSTGGDTYVQETHYNLNTQCDSRQLDSLTQEFGVMASLSRL